MTRSGHLGGNGVETMPQVYRMKSVGSPIAHRGWAFLALSGLMLLLVIPLSRPAEGNVFGESLWNLVHVPLFAVVTLLLRFLQFSAPLRWRSLAVCALAASLLAVFSEAAQGVTGRTPSVEDLAADFGGILLGCTALLRGSGQRVVMLRLPLLLAGLGMLALAARPLVEEVLALIAKRESFPKLIDLERPNGLWQSQGTTRLVVVESSGHAGSGLEVRMASGSYEGLRYAVPKGVDTKGYSGLLIETANPGEAFELGVRMDGDGRQRRYGSFLVPKGRAILNAEWASDLEGGELVRVVLFTGEDQPARKFRLLGARLVRANR
jgi:VanZ family protein